MIFDKDELYARNGSPDSSVIEEPSSGIGIAPSGGGMPGGGSASPPREEIGMLDAIKESSIFVRNAREARLKERETRSNELKGVVSAMEHGVKMLEGLEGDQRTNAVSFYGDQLERLYPGMKDTFAAVADQPNLLTKFNQYLPHLPEPLQVLAKRDPKAFLRFAGTAEGVQTMNRAVDSVELRTATRKVQTTLIGIQQLLPPEIAEKYAQDNVITASEVFDMQQYLPENVRLSDKQLDAVKRSDNVFWTGLGVLSGKGEEDVLKERAKKPKNQTLLGRLRSEREELVAANPDDPMIASYDDMIKKVSQHKPAAPPKPAATPKPAPGPKPPSPRDVAKAEEQDQTIEAVDGRVTSMIEQLQKNSALVGPAGTARRVAETVAGVAAPGIPTPGIDYQQNLKLLLADVRKMVEKDPNLSNEERRNLMETLGGGTFQTSGSAMRALNEVNKYVKAKRKSKPAEDEPSEADLKFTAETHGITVEEVKKRLKDRKK